MTEAGDRIYINATFNAQPALQLVLGD